jgi:hypothetical protein
MHPALGTAAGDGRRLRPGITGDVGPDGADRGRADRAQQTGRHDRCEAGGLGVEFATPSAGVSKVSNSRTRVNFTDRLSFVDL